MKCHTRSRFFVSRVDRYGPVSASQKQKTGSGGALIAFGTGFSGVFIGILARFPRYWCPRDPMKASHVWSHGPREAHGTHLCRPGPWAGPGGGMALKISRVAHHMHAADVPGFCMSAELSANAARQYTSAFGHKHPFHILVRLFAFRVRVRRVYAHHSCLGRHNHDACRALHDLVTC